MAIRYEMIHETRIIPLGNSPRLPASFRHYTGDARGHWDGDTLVVETTNFNDASAYRGASRNLKMTERFTLINPNTIKWEARFEDPATWERPWAMTMPLKRDDEDGGCSSTPATKATAAWRTSCAPRASEEAKGSRRT